MSDFLEDAIKIMHESIKTSVSVVKPLLVNIKDQCSAVCERQLKLRLVIPARKEILFQLCTNCLVLRTLAYHIAEVISEYQTEGVEDIIKQVENDYEVCTKCYRDYYRDRGADKIIIR